MATTDVNSLADVKNHAHTYNMARSKYIHVSVACIPYCIIYTYCYIAMNVTYSM